MQNRPIVSGKQALIGTFAFVGLAGGGALMCSNSIDEARARTGQTDAVAKYGSELWENVQPEWDALDDSCNAPAMDICNKAYDFKVRILQAGQPEPKVCCIVEHTNEGPTFYEAAIDVDDSTHRCGHIGVSSCDWSRYGDALPEKRI